MNSAWIIGGFLLVGPVILVASIAIGLLGFNPVTATAIRSAEAEAPMILEEVRRIHIRSPDRFRHDRLDRHPFYIGSAVAMWGYSWCIFFGSPVTSNVASLPGVTRMTIATCFIIGSTLVLSGSAMGIRVGRWTLLKGIHDNMTSSMLADDIRLPYTFNIAGLIAIGVSSGIYSWTSFGSTLGSLGGWLTGVGIATPSAILITMLFVRIRRYDRARTTLINEAVNQIVVRRDHVDD